MKSIKIIMIWLAMLGAVRGYTQETFGGVPYSFRINTTNPSGEDFVSLTEAVEAMTLPNYENSFLKAYCDSILDSCHCDMWPYGFNIETTVNLFENATLDVVNGIKIYRYRITSANALGLQFFFNEFNLPEDGELYFYSPDKRFLFGSLNSKNNPEELSNGFQMSTAPLLGNDWILEYNVPETSPFEGDLSIGAVVHVFNTSGPWSSGPATPSWWECQVDAECALGDEWDLEKKATIFITFTKNNNAVFGCSGTLVNSTANSEAYAISAGHCFRDVNNVNDVKDGSIRFVYHYLFPTCRNNGDHFPYNSIYSSSGCTVRSAKRTSNTTSNSFDYALLQTSSSAQTLRGFGVCWAGWDRNQALGFRYPYTSLHHPHGFEMKICQSTNQDPDIVDRPDLLTFNFSSTGNWLMPVWEPGKGMTAPGSSGAGFYNTDHKLVGLIKGGIGACEEGEEGPVYNGGANFVSKFNKSWTDGNWGFWLDPSNSGANSCSSFCSPPPSNPNPSNPSPPTVPNPPAAFTQFVVNGKSTPNNNVTQICTSSVILTPSGPWKYRPYNVFKLCNQVTSLNEAGKYDQTCVLGICKCNVAFFQLWIGITECDFNLNPIGTESGQWFNIFDGNHTTSDELSPGYQIDLNVYKPLGFQLQPGKYYRIRVGTVDVDAVPNAWIDRSVFVRTLSFDLSIQNQSTVNSSQAATNNIYISNSNIVAANPAVNVVAGANIVVQPNSNIAKGSLSISNVNCSFLSNLRPGFSNVNTEAGQTSGAGTSGGTYWPRQQEITSRQKDLAVSVSPNPSNSEFNLIVEGAKNRIIKFKVLDVNSRLVLPEEEKLSNEERLECTLKTSSLAAGVYFLILRIDERYKVIKLVKTDNSAFSN